MNWHKRYQQQAEWTRALRDYAFAQAGLSQAKRVLEVGCGTGAILSSLPTSSTPYGLDIDLSALEECRSHVPCAVLIRGDARHLPYKDECFDLAFCHYLLLWVKDPLLALLEMKRVTRRRGFVLALAEPDYGARLDEPPQLAELGQWQSESLKRQGADVRLGLRLADLFRQAGISIRETGTIKPRAPFHLTEKEQQDEWEVLESDLAGIAPPRAVRRLRELDRQAWAGGLRRLDVPTYFAWGQV